MEHVNLKAQERLGPSLEEINETLTSIKFFRHEIILPRIRLDVSPK